MGVLLLIPYALVAFWQLCAFKDGIASHLHLGWILAVIAFAILSSVPLLGALVIAFLTYQGAHDIWGWAWWQALLLTAPAFGFWLVGIGLAGLGAAGGGITSALRRR